MRPPMIPLRIPSLAGFMFAFALAGSPAQACDHVPWYAASLDFMFCDFEIEADAGSRALTAAALLNADPRKRHQLVQLAGAIRSGASAGGAFNAGVAATKSWDATYSAELISETGQKLINFGFDAATIIGSANAAVNGTAATKILSAAIALTANAGKGIWDEIANNSLPNDLRFAYTTRGEFAIEGVQNAQTAAAYIISEAKSGNNAAQVVYDTFLAEVTGCALACSAEEVFAANPDLVENQLIVDILDRVASLPDAEEIEELLDQFDDEIMELQTRQAQALNVAINRHNAEFRAFADQYFADQEARRRHEAAKAARELARAQERLRFQTTIGGLRGSVALVSAALRATGDEDLAALAGTFGAVSTAAIDMAEASNAFLTTLQSLEDVGLGDDLGLQIMATAAFSGNVVSIATNLAGTLSGVPSPNAQIMAQLQRISEQIEALHQEMRASFLRVEERLDDMMELSVVLLREIRLQGAQIEGLADQLLTMRRSTLAFYLGQLAMFGEDRRDELQDAIDQCIFVPRLNGEQLPYSGPDSFSTCAGFMIGYLRGDAYDNTLAGGDVVTGDFALADARAAIERLGLRSALNLIERLGSAEILGAPALSPIHVAGPTGTGAFPNIADLTVGTAALAMLYGDNEAHARRFSLAPIAAEAGLIDQIEAVERGMAAFAYREHPREVPPIILAALGEDYCERAMTDPNLRLVVCYASYIDNALEAIRGLHRQLLQTLVTQRNIERVGLSSYDLAGAETALFARARNPDALFPEWHFPLYNAFPGAHPIGTRLALEARLGAPIHDCNDPAVTVALEPNHRGRVLEAILHNGLAAAERTWAILSGRHNLCIRRTWERVDANSQVRRVTFRESLDREGAPDLTVDVQFESREQYVGGVSEVFIELSTLHARIGGEINFYRFARGVRRDDGFDHAARVALVTEELGSLQDAVQQELERRTMVKLGALDFDTAVAELDGRFAVLEAMIAVAMPETLAHNQALRRFLFDWDLAPVLRTPWIKERAVAEILSRADMDSVTGEADLLLNRIGQSLDRTQDLMTRDSLSQDRQFDFAKAQLLLIAREIGGEPEAELSYRTDYEFADGSLRLAALTQPVNPALSRLDYVETSAIDGAAAERQIHQFWLSFDTLDGTGNTDGVLGSYEICSDFPGIEAVDAFSATVEAPADGTVHDLNTRLLNTMPRRLCMEGRVPGLVTLAIDVPVAAPPPPAPEPPQSEVWVRLSGGDGSNARWSEAACYEGERCLLLDVDDDTDADLVTIDCATRVVSVHLSWSGRFVYAGTLEGSLTCSRVNAISPEVNLIAEAANIQGTQHYRLWRVGRRTLQENRVIGPMRICRLPQVACRFGVLRRTERVGVVTTGFGDVRVYRQDGSKEVWKRDVCNGGELCQLADLNGDGLDDLVAFDNGLSGSSRVRSALTLPAYGTRMPPQFGEMLDWNGFFCTAEEVCASGDLDGDGRDDLIAFHNGKDGSHEVWASLSTGHDAAQNTLLTNNFCHAGETCAVADVDGDGRDDLIAFHQSPKH